MTKRANSRAAGVLLLASAFVSGVAQAGYLVETISNSRVTSGNIQSQATYNLGGAQVGAGFPALSTAPGYTGGQAGTVDPVAGPVGQATGSFDQTTGRFVYGSPFPDATAVSYAASDLATGAVRAAGFATVYGATDASAKMRDTLHFTIANATATTVTPITVHWSLDGIWSYDLASWSGEVIGGMDLGNGHVLAHMGGGFGTAAGFLQGTGQSGWTSFSYASDTITNIDFSGDLQLVGASVDLPFTMGLSVSAGSSTVHPTTVDFANTGRIGLVLPSNVSFTSDSGVFLRAPAPPSAAPEPGTLALLGLGLAALHRRRRPLAT